VKLCVYCVAVAAVKFLSKPDSMITAKFRGRKFNKYDFWARIPGLFLSFCLLSNSSDNKSSLCWCFQAEIDPKSTIYYFISWPVNSPAVCLFLWIFIFKWVSNVFSQSLQKSWLTLSFINERFRENNWLRKTYAQFCQSK
jgi:hypothetical protein